MNITISADERLIEKARAYAQSNSTTLNQLLRDYMERVTGQIDGPAAAREFAEIARQQPGRSDADFVFRRSELHTRGRPA